jgi:hypothetical protein
MLWVSPPSSWRMLLALWFPCGCARPEPLTRGASTGHSSDSELPLAALPPQGQQCHPSCHLGSCARLNLEWRADRLQTQSRDLALRRMSLYITSKETGWVPSPQVLGWPGTRCGAGSTMGAPSGARGQCQGSSGFRLGPGRGNW